MKKFLLHILKYGLILFILINAIAWLNLYFLRNSSFYKPSFLTHEVKQTQFDYVVIGSSIGLTTLDTKLIDSLTNKKGINLSIDDTAISSNYLMLNHFFKQGKKTQFCVLALSHWDLAIEHPVLNDNDYRFLPFVSNDYVSDYYQNCEEGYFKPLMLSQYIPAIGVCYYNTEVFYPSLIAAIRPNKKNRFDENGNYFYPETAEVPEKQIESIALNWKNPYVQKISDLCKENNTRLIIYQAPIYKTNVVNTNSSYPFINHASALKDKLYFYDNIHVNYLGRKAASALFATQFQSYFNSK
ncbi:hypothetical protein [Flavobacterium sp.]|uniref:hypothetical protein n=1 Tax=Flavobacterium sp. TaxID=239 RepID=UPI002B4AC2A8|nr:hypothetical protein [Flavobacterium sp.]HLP63697.1 hypothetical protein [Flavobacterium sp.]